MSSPSQSDEASKSSRAPKGKVYLDELAIKRSKGIKTTVTFNQRGQPLDKAGAKLQSYIGVLARQQLKVTYRGWKDVPEEAKETIWESVKLVFDLPESWKKNCLSSASTKWRQWKSTLYMTHIVPHEDNPDMLFHPPPNEGILEADWKEFVIARLSEAAKRKSTEHKELRSRNVYPHRISRKGYAKLREEMLKKDLLSGDEEVDRALLWKKARANKDGVFEGDMMIETVAKIDEYIAQKSVGTFSSTNISDDILSQAIGKPESSGRMKGVGCYITPSIYRNICSDNAKDKEIKKLKQEMAEVKEHVKEIMGMIKGGALQEEKGSCSTKNDVVSLEKDDDEEVIPVKVNKGESTKKSIKLKDPDMPPSLRMLYLVAKLSLGDDGSICIPVDEDVFGENDKNIFILFDDIHNFCGLQPIGVGCISVFILYLYKMCVNKNFQDKVRFVDPYSCSLKIDSVEKANILSRRLIGTSPNQLVFVPCNVGFHWILVVVDAHGDKAYVLDSLRNPLHYTEWRNITEMAMKVFRRSIGKRGENFDWKVVSCPRQPDGSQCGYYVMRYMKDIIEGIREDIPPTDVFTEVYRRCDIDEVRIEWFEFLQSYIDIMG